MSMRAFPPQTARRIWFMLFALSTAESVGAFFAGPYWHGGSALGAFNGLGTFFAGAATTFFLLAKTEPGKSFGARVSRYVFAAAGGYSGKSILMWALWASGLPIAHSAHVPMADTYWMGPATLVYAVMVWVGYRRALAREHR